MCPKPLFPPLTAEARALLARLEPALDAAVPLRPRHRADLPDVVAELSRALTSERGLLKRDYMSDPRLLSAYLRYFLPWNLYRQVRLFAGLELALPDNGTVVDLGAGPLTSMLALWLARPELRQRALTFVCLDKSLKPMRTGLAVFEHWAGKTPWHAALVKGGVGAPVREKADLLVLANALNEFGWTGREGDDERAARLARTLSHGLTPQGRLLVVEPGVRLAARALAILREACIGQGLDILAPCPHQGPCPMPGLAGKAWCHFNFGVEGAPNWLTKLSAAAGLGKTGASLGFALFAQGHARPKDAGPLVRVVSEPFAVAGGRGQYGCSARGLTLLSFAAGGRPLLPGDLVPADWPATPQRDPKSGAHILPFPGDEKGHARR